MKTLVGLLFVAAVATLGDYTWYTYGVRHTMAAGLIHGAALLTAVGAVLGASAGHLLKGLPIGTLAGLGGAASYYALVALVDRRTYGAAIPAAWVIMWLILATLDGRWLRAARQRSWAEVAGRGVIAAFAGGLAFYLVMNVLWGRPPAGGRNYAVQFLAWTFAWAPGLLALTAGRAPTPSAQPSAPSSQPSAPSAQPSAPSAQPSMTGSAPPASPTEEPIAPADLLARIDRGDRLNVLDVRSDGEFAAGHVPGAVNIPFTQILSRLDEVPGAARDQLIVYCGHGPRAYMAAAALRRGGRANIIYLSGHWAGWQEAGLREER